MVREKGGARKSLSVTQYPGTMIRSWDYCSALVPAHGILSQNYKKTPVISFYSDWFINLFDCAKTGKYSAWGVSDGNMNSAERLHVLASDSVLVVSYSDTFFNIQDHRFDGHGIIPWVSRPRKIKLLESPSLKPTRGNLLTLTYSKFTFRVRPDLFFSIGLDNFLLG